MADGLEFKLEGIEPILARFDSLSHDARYKGGRFALRKAAQVVREAAIDNAARVDDTSTPEEIAKNIALRWSGRRFRQTGDLSFRVGVLGGARQPNDAKKERRRARLGNTSLESLGEIAGKGKGNPGGDTFYWRFLEFGTSRIAARPFMRPALQRNVGKATDVFVAEFSKAVDRAIKRAKKE